MGSLLYIPSKCVVLFVYYSLLQYFGLGIEFKLWTFLLFCPIVKYFYFQKTTPKEELLKKFITATIMDVIFGIISYKFFFRLEGVWLVLYIPLLAFLLVITEYIQFRILGAKDEEYVLKFSPNPLDYSLVPVISLAFFFAGILHNPIQSIDSPWTFVSWVIIMLISDFVAGFFHFLEHNHPAILKNHLLHHEYRKADLNTVANFYADIIDSTIMSTTFFMYAIILAIFGPHSVGFKEFSLSAAFTHHKYPTHQMTLNWFFEFELIDMIMNRVRLSNYHNAHHNLVDQNFSVYGFVPDSVYTNLNSYLEFVPKKDRRRE